MENKDVLEYKNFWLFYTNLYTRLFQEINFLIDHRKYNINEVKNHIIDFLDWYSYYLVKQKLITKEEKEKAELLPKFKEFESFYKELEKYPSMEFLKARQELKRNDYEVSKLNKSYYMTLTQEYYLFLEQVLLVIKRFIKITSDIGFLPNVKSKHSLKSIGYANFDTFFKELEGLKLKASDITNGINVNNMLKCRRCMYCILIVFSPYFRDLEVYEELEKGLSFSFLNDKEIIEDIFKCYNYDIIPVNLLDRINNKILNDLKRNISYIKRYISYEFGELDLAPKIKKKYAYDPTGV